MAHLLMVELPGGHDVDIVRAALDRGDRFTFLTARLAHYQAQPVAAAALGLAHEVIEVASFDFDEVLRRVLAVHQRLRIDAVLCLVDTRLVEAARLAEHLDLPHIRPDTARLLRDKAQVRARLARQGIVQPAFARAGAFAELHQAVAALGLPVVVKPSDGHGAQHVVALHRPEDLDALPGLPNGWEPCRSDDGLGLCTDARRLLERCLSGTLIGCDTQSVQGRHRLLGIHTKQGFERPSFAVRNNTFTPDHAERAAIERYVFAVLDALGFDWGATHTELMLTAEGPLLIEVNPRLAGARLARQVGYALQRSPHADLIALHLGGWPAAGPLQPPARVAVARWVAAERAGVLRHFELPRWRDERIRCIEMTKRSGDAVRPPLDDTDRLGYVMVTDADAQRAEALAKRFVDEVAVVLQSPGGDAARRNPPPRSPMRAAG